MNHPLLIREMRVVPLAIPMRLTFEHAAASRNVADPVVIRVTASSPYAHIAGYGETLARPYVTGETVESVMQDTVECFGHLLPQFAPRSFAEALEFIEALPFDEDGRVITAARAALELALLDLAGQAFRRRASDAAGWLELPGFGPPGCLETARYSGVVIGKTRETLRRMLWLQRLYGLRDFKIKVGTDGWEERLVFAHEYLRRPLENGTVTLRADANGVWSLVEAHEALGTLERLGVSVLEQPLPETDDDDLFWLAQQSDLDLMADESLVTLGDAARLIADGGVRVLNIRLAKVGGLLPALRMARMAFTADRHVQLGCLVGETSILSAAGAAFLEACPRARFVEGAFGRLLARDDVASPRVQFGYRGKLRPRKGYGLGVSVHDAALTRLQAAPAAAVRIRD